MITYLISYFIVYFDKVLRTYLRPLFNGVYAVILVDYLEFLIIPYL